MSAYLCYEAREGSAHEGVRDSEQLQSGEQPTLIRAARGSMLGRALDEEGGEAAIVIRDEQLNRCRREGRL